jgi:RNA polymerase subunit RPABC4/transcription elongation factor Spt4
MAEHPESVPSTVSPPISIPEAGVAKLSTSIQWRCPRCGSTDLASAYLIDYSDKFRQLQLAPRALKLGRVGRMLRPFRRLIKVSAQVCRNCGAVTLEVDPEDFLQAEERYGRR